MKSGELDHTESGEGYPVTHTHARSLSLEMEEEEEEEIQSHASSGSRSPSTYQSRSESPAAEQGGSISSVALALPMQQGKASSNGGGGGGREECWSEGATGVLIEAWGERYVELSRGNLKQKHWKEVADIVTSREGFSKLPKTDVQCKNRIDTVKKKFKQEKAKIVASGGCVVSTWPFYERLDTLIGSTVKIPAINTPSPAVATSTFTFPAGKIPVRSRSKTARSGDGRIVKSRKRGSKSDEDEDEDEGEGEGDWETDDSLPPEKKLRVVVRREGKRGGGRGGRGSSIRMLTQAIVKLGQVYEQAENAKLLQVVEMEKSRMKFAKELELQRMQFFVKTQMEISQFRHGGGGGGRISSGGGGGGRNRHNTNDNVDVVDNVSDSEN